jgi:hypothetical protein
VTDEGSVAIELERLRGTLATGFAEVKGSLAVLVERSDRNEKDVKKLREDTDRDISALRTDIEALKKSRWPTPQLNALVGVGALAVAMLALFLQ